MYRCRTYLSRYCVALPSSPPTSRGLFLRSSSYRYRTINTAPWNVGSRNDRRQADALLPRDRYRDKDERKDELKTYHVPEDKISQVLEHVESGTAKLSHFEKALVNKAKAGTALPGAAMRQFDRLADKVKIKSIGNNEEAILAEVTRLMRQHRSTLVIEKFLRSKSYQADTISAWNFYFSELLAWKNFRTRGRIAQVSRVYRDMRNCGVSPNSRTFMVLFKGLANYVEHQDSNETIILQATKRVTVFWHSLMEQNSKIVPSIMLTNAALNVFALSGRGLNLMWPMIAKMPESGDGAADNITYTTIMKAIWRAAKLPDGNAAQAVIDAKKIWIEYVAASEKNAKLSIDEKLVIMMARLLMLSSDRKDHNFIPALLEAHFGLPHVDTPKGSGVTKPDEAFNIALRAMIKTGSASPSHERLVASNNTLSLLLQYCDSTNNAQAAETYWAALTKSDHHDVSPDLDNLNSMLRILRKQGSSAAALRYLEDYLAPKDVKTPVDHATFRISMSCCIRNSQDKERCEHATRIVEIMKAEKRIDCQALNSYGELVLTKHQEKQAFAQAIRHLSKYARDAANKQRNPWAAPVDASSMHGLLDTLGKLVRVATKKNWVEELDRPGYDRILEHVIPALRQSFPVSQEASEYPEELATDHQRKRFQQPAYASRYKGGHLAYPYEPVDIEEPPAETMEDAQKARFEKHDRAHAAFAFETGKAAGFGGTAAERLRRRIRSVRSGPSEEVNHSVKDPRAPAAVHERLAKRQDNAFAKTDKTKKPPRPGSSGEMMGSTVSGTEEIPRRPGANRQRAQTNTNSIRGSGRKAKIILSSERKSGRGPTAKSTPERRPRLKRKSLSGVDATRIAREMILDRMIHREYAATRKAAGWSK